VNPEPEPGGAFLMFRTSPEMLEFKQELFDLAVSRFMGKFSMKYVDWLCEKKRSYLSELVALAAGIERQNSFRELKADLTEDSLTLKMHDVRLHHNHNAPIARCAPLLTSCFGDDVGDDEVVPHD